MTSNVIKDKFSYSLINTINLNQLIHIEVPDFVKINDNRPLKEFKIQTFGGYKKTHVITNLDKAIKEENLDYAIYLSFQLFFSGVVYFLWDKLYNLSIKFINVNNPSMPIFLWNRYKKWDTIVTNPIYNKESILFIRNNNEIRNLLIELITIVTLSRKKKLDQLPKILQNDYKLEVFKSKLEAKDTSLIDNIVLENDPSEIRIAINEFAYHLYKRNINKTLYWLSWLLEWDKQNTKKYGKYEINFRSVDNIETKYLKNIVWLIWDVINTLRHSVFLFENIIDEQENNNIDALWNLYKYKFSLSQKSKKNAYIIWAIKYITTNIDWKIPLIDREYILFQNCANINLIIQKMKSQEVNNNIYKNRKFNLVIENNYMRPQNYKKIEKEKKQKELLKLKQKKEKEAKQKKISMNSLDKLNKMQIMDRILNS